MESRSPILIVSSTNRPGSLTRTVSQYCLELLQKRQIEGEIACLTNLPADFTSTALYQHKRKNPLFNRLADQVDRFSRYIFILPQYNGSFPGVFKAFIDGYASPHIFAGKKGALAGVSKGRQGCLLGLSHAADILMYLGMGIYPMQPKLAEIPDPSRASLEQFPDDLRRLEEMVEGFLHF